MKKTPPYLQIALSDEQWVSIRSVASGLACNCCCPACGSALIAKKGRIQQHHFAHAHGAVCVGSLETTLHCYAKSVIAEAKSVLTPGVAVFRGGTIRPPRWAKGNSAQVEVRQDKFQIDVLLLGNNFRLAIEIRVSHAVDVYKKQYFIRQGIAAIEIDVASIYQELLATRQADNLSALRRAILQHPTHRKWLFSPFQHRWEYRLAKEAQPLKVVISQHVNYHHYHVYHCPLNLRFVRGGFRDGQSYARVFQDCLHCQHCREIVYEKKWVGFQRIPVLPQQVLCHG